MKSGFKQNQPGSGAGKINFSGLKACLSTATKYNQTFEGPSNQSEPLANPSETKSNIIETQQKAYEPPQKIYEPPQKTYEAPQKTYEAPQKSYEPPQKTYEAPPKFREPPPKEYDNQQKYYDAPQKPSNFNNKPPQYDNANQEHSSRFKDFKVFSKDRPSNKNRSFSPQPHKSYNAESFEQNRFARPNEPSKDFPRKKGLGFSKDLQPDILIDMKNAENTSIFELGISEITTKLLAKRNIYNLFPLQVQSYEPIKSGLDLIGKAKTGTGKTLAFVLPLLERLRESKIKRVPKILVVSPTRELANQIAEEFKYYGPDFRMVCCYGGVPLNRQIDLISRGVEIIVATPGRLLDLMGRQVIPLEHISTVVIDEADHMMDIGFKDDLDEILNVVNSNVKDLQLLLFSATMPAWIKNIVSTYLKPDKLFIDAVGHENQTADKIKHYAIPCTDEDLEKTLELVISYYANKGKALIFTDTKSHVAHLTQRMENGINRVGCLHGDMNQYSRDQTINGFKHGEINCLIATDVAARGLDIPNVELVFQVRPPQNISNYIHRSGRTGRVGKAGISVLMFNPLEDNDILMEIEKKGGIEFERRGIPTQEEFIELIAQLKNELRESRLADKESLISGGRFKPQEIKVPKGLLEDSLAKVCQQQNYVTRSLLTGNSRKMTLLFTSKSNRKKFELKALIEKLLEGIYIHTWAFTLKDNTVLLDIWTEQKVEVMKRVEQQKDLDAQIPVFIPEHRFFNNQNNEGHSLNHGGKDNRGKGYGHQQKFHKTNSSSQMNQMISGGKKPYTAFNFFARKKEMN